MNDTSETQSEILLFSATPATVPKKTYQETPNAQLMAYRRIVKQSDMLVAVYDPELASDSAEDKAMAYALALGKPTLLIHPNTWKKKWLNVVKREGE